MHMTITHLNPKLWILTYKGFAVIPDLRQTGISENLATFGQNNFVNFSLCPVYLFTKRIRFIPPLVFYIIALQIYREILKKYRKRAITLRKITFLKCYCFRTRSGSKRNFVPKGIPIGFEMVEKNLNKETNKQIDIFVFI